jgi:hypothetical protein
MKTITGSAALALLFAATAIGNAEVLRSEPPAGTLLPGVVVLVDDGTCGEGKIKQVTGGNDMNGRTGSGRRRKCITR